LLVEGALYELQADATYSLFEVKYDHKNDIKKGITKPSKQEPILVKLISKGHTNIVKWIY
jgi:hypothetical protein